MGEILTLPFVVGLPLLFGIVVLDYGLVDRYKKVLINLKRLFTWEFLKVWLTLYVCCLLLFFSEFPQFFFFFDQVTGCRVRMSTGCTPHTGSARMRSRCSSSWGSPPARPSAPSPGQWRTSSAGRSWPWPSASSTPPAAQSNSQGTFGYSSQGDLSVSILYYYFFMMFRQA